MMDPIRMEKFQAMKRYRRRSSREMLPGLLKYTLAITVLGLFLSSPLWLPSLSSFFKLLSRDLISGVAVVALGPRCLFVIGNLIVIFLFGECKLLRPPATAPDIYQEYVNKHSSLLQQCAGKGKAMEKDLAEEEEELTELNKRSENLIARVNEQWRHEARLQLRSNS